MNKNKKILTIITVLLFTITLSFLITSTEKTCERIEGTFMLKYDGQNYYYGPRCTQEFQTRETGDFWIEINEFQDVKESITRVKTLVSEEAAIFLFFKGSEDYPTLTKIMNKIDNAVYDLYLLQLLYSPLDEKFIALKFVGEILQDFPTVPTRKLYYLETNYLLTKPTSNKNIHFIEDLSKINNYKGGTFFNSNDYTIYYKIENYVYKLDREGKYYLYEDEFPEEISHTKFKLEANSLVEVPFESKCQLVYNPINNDVISYEQVNENLKLFFKGDACNPQKRLNLISNIKFSGQEFSAYKDHEENKIYFVPMPSQNKILAVMKLPFSQRHELHNAYDMHSILINSSEEYYVISYHGTLIPLEKQNFSGRKIDSTGTKISLFKTSSLKYFISWNSYSARELYPLNTFEEGQFFLLETSDAELIFYAKKGEEFIQLREYNNEFYMLDSNFKFKAKFLRSGYQMILQEGGTE